MKTKTVFAMLFFCLCALAQDFVITLNPSGSIDVAAASTPQVGYFNNFSTVVARIVDSKGNPPPEPATVNWTVSTAVRGSGYHTHELTESIVRPPAKVDVTPTRTDPQGYTHTVVNWPQYAGIYTVTACSVGTINVCDQGTWNVMSVQSSMNELVQLTPGTGFSVLADPDHNNGNMWLTSFEVFAIRDIGLKFFQQTGGASFIVGRGSLRWGAWNDDDTAHFSTVNSDPHPYGTNWDIVLNKLSTAQKMLLISIIDKEPAQNGGDCVVTDFPLSIGNVYDVRCE